MKIHANASRFTLMELLLVVAVIAMLASMLLPALRRAKEASKRIDCGGRLKQIGTGLITYSQDYSDLIPPYTDVGLSDWSERLAPYLNERPRLSWKKRVDNTIYRCPSTRIISALTDIAESYTVSVGDSEVTFMDVYDPGGLHLYKSARTTKWLDPSTLFLLYDGLLDPACGRPRPATPWSMEAAVYGMKPDPRHGSIANFLFADFHVGFINEKGIVMNGNSHIKQDGPIHFNKSLLLY